MATVIDDTDRDIKKALRAAIDNGDVESPLERDLWPRMRARLDAPSSSPSGLDWALAAAIAAIALAFPQIMLGVLYHL